MKTTLLAATLSLLGGMAAAEPEAYVLDASHSQILFSYNHLGYSTTWGMFSGFEGKIAFDREDPAASAVSVSFPVKTMFTGWEERFQHFMSADFFAATEDEMVSFTSRAIEVTSETLNGIGPKPEPHRLDGPLAIDADSVRAFGYPVQRIETTADTLRFPINGSPGGVEERPGDGVRQNRRDMRGDGRFRRRSS